MEEEWTRQTHEVFGSRALTAADPRAPAPPGFRGRLWPPQATLLHAMLALERCPCLRVAPPDEGCDGGDPESLIRCAGARIAAEFSFGKTVLSVALVCASPLPRAFPHLLALPLMNAPRGCNCLQVGRHARSTGYSFTPAGRGSFPTLALRYQRLLRATLVVAAPSVISQWEACIETFAPHLAFFTIENVRTLREFHGFFRTAAMGRVDLVLLKAGKVTTTFVVAGEKTPETRQRALTAALAAVTEGYAWGRMIVDDFDTIRLASEDVFLPALFTWVISATCRSTMVRQEVRSAPTVAEFIRANSSLPILSAASNGLYDAVLKLYCDEGYVGDHISSTTVAYRRVVVEGGRAVGILQDLGVPDEVVEMAAAGAVETAAEHLNIKVSSIGDLVERVLAARTEKYRKAVRTLARVARARAVATGGAHRPRNTNEEMQAIRAALKDGTDAEAEGALARLGAPSPLFTAAARTLEDWALKERDEHGGRLQRMRDNVRQSCCQACMVPIDNESYIVNCCQIVICGFCTIVDVPAGPARRRSRYINRCPNCASNVDPSRDLIYVGKDLDLEEVLVDESLVPACCPGGGAEEAEEGEAPPACCPGGGAEGAEEGEGPPAPRGGDDGNYERWADTPRLRALLQLIRGAPVSALSDEETGPVVDGLLEGRKTVPRPAGAPRKFLVFAMHAESTRHILAALAAEEIPHAHLSGKRQKKDEAVARFKDPGGVHVLVATSSRDCAGLHLPEVGTLVLYNHHNDKEVAKQALGRAQRVGRLFSLEVVEIMNEGEAARFG